MATRFRLPNDTTAPAVSPALQSYSHNAPTTVRRKLVLSGGGSLTTTAYTPDAADHLVAGDALWCQFVSDPMAAGIAFLNGQAIKYAVMGLEANAGNNLNTQIFVSIVSQDGGTVRRTLLGKTANTSELATTLRNNSASATQTGADYTTVAGDRLVVELSVVGTPIAAGGTQGHNSSMRFGQQGIDGDLPENDTDTVSTKAPWVEFVPSNLFPEEHSGSASAASAASSTSASGGKQGLGSASAASASSAATATGAAQRQGLATAASHASATSASGFAPEEHSGSADAASASSSTSASGGKGGAGSASAASHASSTSSVAGAPARAGSAAPAAATSASSASGDRQAAGSATAPHTAATSATGASHRAGSASPSTATSSTSASGSAGGAGSAPSASHASATSASGAKGANGSAASSSSSSTSASGSAGAFGAEGSADPASHVASTSASGGKGASGSASVAHFSDVAPVPGFGAREGFAVVAHGSATLAVGEGFHPAPLPPGPIPTTVGTRPGPLVTVRGQGLSGTLSPRRGPPSAVAVRPSVDVLTQED